MPTSENTNEKGVLAAIPAVNEVLQEPEILALLERHPRRLVVEAARDVLQRVRMRVLEGRGKVPPTRELASQVASLVAAKVRPSIRRVINATGVVLHTGLGRAVMSQQAADAVAEAIAGHCNLEIDSVTGRRGSRDVHTSWLLSYLTGAESGTIVNNNAASVMLILNTLAEGKEVVISRGELIEIGGSFRLPDVIRRSGAVMREVGTTNKTHLYDYEAAVGENTGAILKVHQSNYKMVGFTEQVPLQDLVELGRRRGVPVVEDLGSGALVDLRAYGLSQEPLVQDSVSVGADLVCFSGDKLLGGPQAGIIVGRHHLIQAIKRNPLFRVLRCDKIRIAALEATLRLYLDPDGPATHVPPIRILARKPEEIEAECRALLSELPEQVRQRLNAEVEKGVSEIGGGSLPGEQLPTYLVALRPDGMDAEELARRLRSCDPPVYARVSKEAVLLDMRTVLDGERAQIASALSALVGEAVP
ncbi:MAG: L-seryl-tRNA(Sec) selenium transferase [Armatimonadota bacterium]